MVLQRDFPSGTRGLRSMRFRLRYSGTSKTNASVSTGEKKGDRSNQQLPTSTMPKNLRPLDLLSMRIPCLAESVVSETDPSSRSSAVSNSADYDSSSSRSVSEHQNHVTTIQKRPRPRIIEEVVSRELRAKIHQRIIKFAEVLPSSIGPLVNIIFPLVVLSAVLLKQPWILAYGALWILFQSVVHVCQKWFQFYAQDPEIIRCIRCVKVFVGQVLDEGNKALSGNYARQVVAAYLIMSSIGPGESYFGKVIRYKWHVSASKLLIKLLIPCVLGLT